MRRFPQLCASTGATLLLLSSTLSAQCELTKLEDPMAAPGDGLGQSVAISDDWAMVSAIGVFPYFDASAHVFQRTAGGWVPTQRLQASDFAVGDDFGYHVDLSGDRAIVASESHYHGGLANRGAVYIFELGTDTWHEVAELAGSDSTMGDFFGIGAAVDGEIVAAGATGHDPNGLTFAGSVYVFERSSTGRWEETAKLVASDAVALHRLGGSVDVCETTIVAGATGAPGTEDNQGAAYVFERTPQGWVETAKLLPDAGSGFSLFGQAVATSGDVVLVGAQRTTTYATEDGAAYLFERSSSGWSLSSRIQAPDPIAYQRFGSAVAFDGTDTAYISALGADGAAPTTGAVYVYRRTEAGWVFAAKLTAREGQALDFFSPLAVDGETVLIGAPGHDGAAGVNQGLATIFQVPRLVTPFGFCTGMGACGNADALAGCKTSLGSGARVSACGSTSVSADDFTIQATELPPLRYATLLRAPAAHRTLFGDGVRVVGPGAGIVRTPPQLTGSDGSLTFGPDLLSATGVLAGDTWYYQVLFRDPGGPCNQGFNLTQGLRVTFLP